MASTRSTTARTLARQGRLFRVSVAGLVVILFLVPLLYVVMVALESESGFERSPLRLPLHLDLGNFTAAWQQADLGVELLNTVLYSAVAAGLSTVLSLLIAFPLARRLVPMAEGLYRSLMIGFFLPIAIIPLFIEAHWLHLYNNRFGYIILHVEPGIPLGVLVLIAVIRSLPLELDEAAQVDGCPYWRYLWEVVTPVAAPGMVVTFLYAALNVWNDIIGPTIFLSSPSLDPVSRGILSFEGEHMTEWPLLMAALVVASLPVLALFLVMQRRLVRASIGGALK